MACDYSISSRISQPNFMQQSDRYIPFGNNFSFGILKVTLTLLIGAAHRYIDIKHFKTGKTGAFDSNGLHQDH